MLRTEVPQHEVLRPILDHLGTMILALTLAMVVWVVAINEESRESFLPEGIPIEVVNRPEGLILVGGVEEQVRVRIRAPEDTWKYLDANSFRAFIDLKGLESGLHEVDVKVEVGNPQVRIMEKDPAKVTVRLEESKEKEVEVRVNVLDSPPLGYTLKSPTVAPRKVTVSGPQTAVDQVTEAMVEVWLRGAKATIEGEFEVSPRDAQGDLIKGLALSPPSVMVKLPIEQRHGFKDVAIRVIWEGQVAPGYRINEVSVEPSITTVVGSPSAIGEIPGYLETAPVKVEGATADIVERVPLSLPEGVTVLGEQGVLVTIKVAAIESSLTVQRGLTIQGLDSGLSAIPSPDVVDVILSGPLPKLEALKAEEVRVILDLIGLEPGTHKVEPTVLVPEGIVAESILPSTIEVEVFAKPVPTPTSTPQATKVPTLIAIRPTPTPTATPAPLPECPNLKARLTYPTVNAVLRGVVQIRGSADTDNFDYYKLEFRSQGAPVWSFLQRFEEPVADGVLALWDTSSLSPGNYWLRLVVVDVTGNYPEPCEVSVIIEH